MDSVVTFYAEQLVDDFDRERLTTRAACAKHWLATYAPSDFVFTINKDASGIMLDDAQKAVVLDLISALESKSFDAVSLHEEFYVLIQRYKMDNAAFFSLIYTVLISKKKGPKLASFILTIGVKRVISLLKSAVGV